MKLLYTGGNICAQPTLKRLLLVASELVFMDTPSVTFTKWGTVGQQSPLRTLDTSNEPVKVRVVAPPDGPAANFYKPIIEADLSNAEFVRLCLEGLRTDPTFSSRFIQPDARYSEALTGRELLEGLLADSNLTPLPLDDGTEYPLFGIGSMEERRCTLRTIVSNASIMVSSAMAVTDEADAVPVCDDPHLLQLLSLRTGSPKYIGGTAPGAWLLGLEFAKAVIPDKALERLSIPDLLSYRKKTADVYSAWTAELNQIAAKIDDLSPAEVQEHLPKLLVTELKPRLITYKAELANARDKLFADAIRGINDWKMPTLTIASWAALGYGAALAAFAVSVAAKPITDFVSGLRATRRKHAVSYLVGLTDD